MNSQETYPQQLLHFLSRSPTAYHAATTLAERLQTAGFEALDEAQAWSLRPGGRYYVTRNDATLAAFIVGSAPPEESGFHIAGAHTDSPGFKLKPQHFLSRHGYWQWGVEVYGGPIFATWLDRDLSVAGRVVVRSAHDPFRSVLVDLKTPLARITSLAIHLQRTVNQEGMKLNAQSHMAPIWGLASAAVNSPSDQRISAWLTDHLSKQLGEAITPDALLGADLFLYDTQAPQLIGQAQEFIASGRLDNLASCFVAAEALCEAALQSPESKTTRIMVCYDHEEIGSRSMHGAASPFLERLLRRISESSWNGSEQSLDRAYARSLFVSLDMAHALHPNYADLHDAAHGPQLNQGPVIKHNAGQSYATDATTAARFAALCQSVGVRPQHFVMRSDLACGSTIGPISAAQLGIATVDIGMPMLSMHSAREMAGTHDAETMIKVLQPFWR